MTSQLRSLYGLVAVLVAIIVIVSSLAGLYYFQYTKVASENSTYVQELNQLNVRYLSNVLIDYGNGTRMWYNVTNIQPGTNLYVETQIITAGDVNATYYPQYQSHFVTAIFNLGNTKTMYWLVWTYNKTASWQQAQVGPDQLQVTNNSVFAWGFCGGKCTSP